MGCKYVKEFTFGGDQGYTGSAGKTMVRGYARGGHIDEPEDKTLVKQAVHKHEKGMHPGKPLTKLARGGMADTARRIDLEKSLAASKQNPSSPIQNERAARLGQQLANAQAGPQMPGQQGRQAMLNQQLANAQTGAQTANQRDREARLGQQLSLNMRKQYPVGSREPMIAMKKGGVTPKQQAKIGTVMGEHKRGQLHSGSKTGPVVTNPKQATAIAMSEARQVGKKRS